MIGFQLNPGETYTIVRELGDPNDTATYYVRAIIRNSSTGATITTVNLTDQTGQRFTGSWVVIADAEGQGTYVDITTRVFTDSGYTTLSDVYQDENHQHLVQERVVRLNLLGFSGKKKRLGGGESFNWERLQKIIEDALDKNQKLDKEQLIKGLLALESSIKKAIDSHVEVDLKNLISDVSSFRKDMESRMLSMEDMHPKMMEMVRKDIILMREKIMEGIKGISLKPVIEAVVASEQRTGQKIDRVVMEQILGKVQSVEDQLKQAIIALQISNVFNVKVDVAPIIEAAFLALKTVISEQTVGPEVMERIAEELKNTLLDQLTKTESVKGGFDVDDFLRNNRSLFLKQ